MNTLKPGQKIYLSYDGWITRHIIRWSIEKKNKIFYIVTSRWKDTVLESKNVFLTLEEAKLSSVKCLEEKIKDINKLIDEVEKAEKIDFIPEISPQEEAELKRKEEIENPKETLEK